MTPMNGWENFYVIVGSSAGALIGLQFVVMTLIAGRSVSRGEAQAGDAFSTPSVVHFGVVLLLSAIISAPWDGIGTVVVVLFILWMALHSSKIIFAVFVNLFIGLSITTAVGLMMVGSLNLLSIAFAVLFVGLGVDFGIQFSVRYRSERFKNENLALALESAARRSSVPLSLAAMATAAGFLCFLPTDYKGISELGKIAGAGMLIAFITSITALPAMLKLLHPPGESEPVGYAFLAPVDEFLERHRVIIVVGTLLLVVAGLPLLYYMKFDFNPINLRNPKAESIATFLDLRKDPNTGANAINVLTSSEAEAKKIEARLEKLPEVLRVMSIDSFVPEDQPAKLRLIAQAARVVGPALNPDQVDAAPTDEESSSAGMGVNMKLSPPSKERPFWVFPMPPPPAITNGWLGSLLKPAPAPKAGRRLSSAR